MTGSLTSLAASRTLNRLPGVFVKWRGCEKRMGQGGGVSSKAVPLFVWPTARHGKRKCIGARQTASDARK